MSDIPNFTLYGEGDAATEQSIQPALALRRWNALTKTERKTALQQLQNLGWLRPSDDFLQTIQRLNQDFFVCAPESIFIILYPSYIHIARKQIKFDHNNKKPR